MTDSVAQSGTVTSKSLVLGSVMVVLGALLIATTAQAYDDDDCRYSTELSKEVDLTGISEISIDAGAGKLKVVGKTGPDIAKLNGTACAGREGDLNQISIESSRDGETLVLRTVFPSSANFMASNDYAKLDLEVRVPEGMSIRIDDTSGSMNVRNVASVEIYDKSGSIEVRDVEGLVHIVEDGSGSITVLRSGSVRIEEDGSGSITASKIDDNVYIGRDGSGSISAKDVGGSFTVVRDSSGSVSHRNVAGDVQIGEE